MTARFHQLTLILEDLKGFVDSPKTDISWTGLNSIDEVHQLIDLYLEKAKNGDISVFRDLQIFFAPTGSLQEISLSGGWGNAFLKLADRFDRVLIFHK